MAWSWIRKSRLIASNVLGALAAFSLLMGVASACHAHDQIQREKIYAKDFRKAEMYVSSYKAEKGRLPSDNELRRWAREHMESMFADNFTINLCMDDKFQKLPGDTFVLSFWRGEWHECYAAPSGRTTLPANGWWWAYVVPPFLAGFLFSLLAWLIRPKPLLG